MPLRNSPQRQNNTGSIPRDKLNYLSPRINDGTNVEGQMDQAEIRRVKKTVEAIYGYNHGRPGTPAISLLGLYGLPRRMTSGLPVWNVLKLLPGRGLAEQKSHRTLEGA